MDGRHYDHERLKQLRMARSPRLTQDELATLVFGGREVGRITRGERRIITRAESGSQVTFENLARLAAFHGISLHDLIYPYPAI